MLPMPRKTRLSPRSGRPTRPIAPQLSLCPRLSWNRSVSVPLKPFWPVRKVHRYLRGGDGRPFPSSSSLRNSRPRTAYGVTLTFQTIHTSISDELKPLFATGSPDGASVDALIGAHDWIGSLAHDNVIEPIVLSKEHHDAFRSWTLDALTYDARLYGLPTTLDTTALIRNVNLVPHPPVTMEDLIATGDDLRREGRVAETLVVRVTDQGDPFQSWPLFASAGGSLFDMIDGAWDPKRVILDSPASISAFDRLRSLGERGNGLLRRSMDRTQVFQLFSSGQAPYLISGSDGLTSDPE